MIKRVLLTILAFVALFALARCGGRAEPEVPPAKPELNLSAEAEKLVALAKADLAAHLGVSEGEVIVHNVVPAQFPDASLGVPEPDMVYAQVIHDGYMIHIEVDGKYFQYNGSGDRVVHVPEG
jgi:hypothetical protein